MSGGAFHLDEHVILLQSDGVQAVGADIAVFSQGCFLDDTLTGSHHQITVLDAAVLQLDAGADLLAAGELKQIHDGGTLGGTAGLGNLEGS